MSSPPAQAQAAPRIGPGDAQALLLSRRSVAFMLDLILTARGGRPLLEALLMTAIPQANLAEIRRQADLRPISADAESAPPDDRLRPLSLNALAGSLSLPYETVRRQVRRLARDGLVERVPGGVIVPGRVLTSTRYLATGLAVHDHLRAVYHDLRALGLLTRLPPRNADLPPDVLPLEVTSRLISDDVLRFVAAIVGAMGDLIDGLVVLEVFRSNVENLPLPAPGGDCLEAHDGVEDDRRTPVAVSRLAARLSLPGETVRRRVRRLEATGALERRVGGMIAPAAALGRPELREAMDHANASLQRLLARLAQLGVLAVWDAMPEAPAPRAET